MMRGTRLVLALLAASSLAACADTTPGVTGGDGHTRVLLTDAPPSGALSRVDLYIAKIEASTSLDTTAGAQTWVTIAEPQKSFNLLDLQQGTTALAGEVDIPAGQYQAIRVTINTAQSSVTDASGHAVSVSWPVSGDLALYAYVEHALDVPAGGAQIVIDFDVNRTFEDNGSGGLWFIPWIRAVNDAETGSVAGTVTGPGIEGESEPVAGAYVTVTTHPGIGQMPAITTTTLTDGTGHYVASFVREGDYSVTVQAPANLVFAMNTKSVTVTSGQRATLNFALSRDTTHTDTTTTGGGGGGGGVDTTVTGGGSTGSGPVATVAIQPSTQTVSVGDSVPVMAQLTNAQGQSLSGRTVTWTVSDSTKLTVFGSFANWAVLRATHSGTVTITASVEGKSGTGTVVIR